MPDCSRLGVAAMPREGIPRHHAQFTTVGSLPAMSLLAQSAPTVVNGSPPRCQTPASVGSNTRTLNVLDRTLGGFGFDLAFAEPIK